MMAAENHRPNLLISVPMKSKKPKTKDVVIGTLATTIPIVLPETAASLESSRAASLPNSPAQEPKKAKHLSKPGDSPSHNKKIRTNSDPPCQSPTSPSHHRPKWLIKFSNKVRRRSGDSNTSSDDPIKSSGSASSLEVEATPVATLPGQLDRTLTLQSSSSSIPTITVSSHAGDGEDGCCVAVVENGGEGVESDRLRKLSQSSHSSTVGTSGVGSLLSPSGDEVASDVESPLSPMSGSSSFTDEARDDLSDFDPIERDLVSPSSDLEVLEGSNLSPRGSVSSETTVVPEDAPGGGGGSSSREGGAKKGKRRRDRVTASWMKVKKVVTAWSPFAMQFKTHSYPWVQLAGHEGNFMPGGESGTIMKKSDSNESNALSKLMDDELRGFVPEFKRVVEKEGKMYVEMTDLLREFREPAVMDIKMGIRTYLEEELTKARTKKTLRPDMYDKMIAIDPNEPTEEEHAQHAITKPRYMQWRESMSSTSTLGFRIEGIKTTQGNSHKDFKTMRERADVKKALSLFISERPAIKEPMLHRLMEIREALQRSYFFKHHEVVGSSLLFVFDANGANIHMIDFGKTVELPTNVSVDHRSVWEEGNHEDGYLWGLDKLVTLWKEL